jgi:putative tricarboxylic transport membrane protein
MDRICGILVFLLGSAILWQGRNLAIGSLRAPGPGFFPNLVAITMMILSFFLIIPRRRGNGEPISPQSAFRVLILFLALLAYSFALEYLGFSLVSFLLMTYLFKTFSDSQKWYVAVSWALLSVGFAYVLFDILLGSNLPKGILGF